MFWGGSSLKTGSDGEMSGRGRVSVRYGPLAHFTHLHKSGFIHPPSPFSRRTLLAFTNLLFSYSQIGIQVN